MKVVKTAAPTLVLPEEKTVPSNRFADYSLLIYGREKIGKTTFASIFPNALFLFFEPGGKSLSLYARNVTSWQDFLTFSSLLSRTSRFENVVIDTVDLAYKMCETFVCEKLGVTHPSEEEWGKGWNMIRDNFALAMARLQSGRRGVIFISHAEEKEIKRRGGGSSHRVVPTMPKGAVKILGPMVDVWGYYSYDEGEGRVLRIRGSEDVAAGCRIRGHFDGIDVIPMGRSPEEAYANFMAAFLNQTPWKKGGSAQPIPKPRVVVKRA